MSMHGFREYIDGEEITCFGGDVTRAMMRRIWGEGEKMGDQKPLRIAEEIETLEDLFTWMALRNVQLSFRGDEVIAHVRGKEGVECRFVTLSPGMSLHYQVLALLVKLDQLLCRQEKRYVMDLSPPVNPGQ